MTVTNHAVVTWKWGVTNVAFARSAGGNGAVTGPTNGWYLIGSSVSVTATPSLYYHFFLWTGDVTGNPSNSPLALTLNRARTVIASFAENQATNHNTPEWWMAQYGMTNNFNARELLDPDLDGMPTWEEYIAGTDPTNANSALAIQELEMSPFGDPVIVWPTAPGRTYAVSVSTDLSAPGGGFETVASNLSATTHSFTDTVHRGSAVFYRIEVKK
jgi:hypothetical protein